MSEISFTDLKLIEPIERALKSANYEHPTPIQAQAIPHLLEGGDLLGCAQTGTGKTAAFTLPVLQRLHASGNVPRKREVRSLILTPTRELAVQISESVRKYGKHLNLRSTLVYGGVGYGNQIRALGQGVDVLIATPGRLLDLMAQNHLRLNAVEMLVLDEADRMLDMGFIKDVRKILKDIPKERQTLLFSATMPAEVAHLADSVLSNPKKVQVNPQSSTADLIEDRVLFVESGNKGALLNEILRSEEVERTLIFTRTKHRANRLAKQLNAQRIKAEAIHGNKSQGARQKALKEFSTGRVKVLVATDIVARGIDVVGITHVINYELPNEPESYIHRIGRTARAGTSGIALSFCDQEEGEYLVAIEKLLKRKITVNIEHPYHSQQIQDRSAQGKAKKSRGPGKRRSPQGRPGRSSARPNPRANARRRSSGRRSSSAQAAV